MYVITYSYSCHARTLVTWKAPQTTARMSVNVFNLLNGSYKSKHWQKRGERTRAHCSLQNDYLLGLAKCEGTPIIYTQVTIQSLTLWLPIINSQNAQFNVSRWYKVNNNNDLKQHASLLIGKVYWNVRTTEGSLVSRGLSILASMLHIFTPLKLVIFSEIISHCGNESF